MCVGGPYQLSMPVYLLVSKLIYICGFMSIYLSLYMLEGNK